MVISLTPYLSASFLIVSWRLLLDSIFFIDFTWVAVSFNPTGRVD
jgi:hypothetical protein